LPRPDLAGVLLLTRRATARVVLAHAVALLTMREPRPGCSAFDAKPSTPLAGAVGALDAGAAGVGSAT
jgi:hypothetical protein